MVTQQTPGHVGHGRDTWGGPQGLPKTETLVVSSADPTEIVVTDATVQLFVTVFAEAHFTWAPDQATANTKIDTDFGRLLANSGTPFGEAGNTSLNYYIRSAGAAVVSGLSHWKHKEA